MAEISSTMALNNGMSSVLKTIYQSMQPVMGAMSDIQTMMGTSVDNTFIDEATLDFVEAQSEAQQFNDELVNVRDQIDQTSGGLGGIPPEIKRGTSEAKKLGNELENAAQQSTMLDKVLKGLTIAGITKMASSFFKATKNIADAYNLKNAQIAQMAGGLEEADALQRRIMQSANSVNAEFAMMTGTIYKLNATVGEMLGSTDSVVQMAENIKMGASISATGAHGIEMSFRVIERAMAQGRMAAQDFDLLKQYNVRAVEAMAGHLGVSVLEVRNLATQGELTRDVIAGAMLGATTDIQNDFKKIPKTWADITVRMRNHTLQAFGPLMRMWSDFINGDDFQVFLNLWEAGIQGVAMSLNWLFGLFQKGFGIVVRGVGVVVNHLDLVVLGLLALGGVYLWTQKKAIATFATKIVYALLVAKVYAQVAIAMAGHYVKSAYAALKAWSLAFAQKAYLAMQNAIVIIKSAITTKIAQIKAIFASTAAFLKASLLQKAAILSVKMFSIKSSIAMAMASVKATMTMALGWIKAALPILFVIGIIVGLIKLLDFFGITAEDVIGFVAGLFGGLFAFVFNLFASFFNIVSAVVEFFANVWHDPIGSVKMLFYNLASSVLNFFASIIDATGAVGNAIADAFIFGVNAAIRAINWLVRAINKIPGMNISEMNSVATRAEAGGSGGDAIRGMLTAPEVSDGYWHAPRMDLMDIMDTANSWNQGARNGLNGIRDALSGIGNVPDNLPGGLDGIDDLMGGLGNELGGLGGGLGDINDKLGAGLGAGTNIGDIGQIRDDITISDEDIKLLRDVAERDVIVNYQQITPNVSLTVNEAGGKIDERKLLTRLEDMIIDKSATALST